MSVFPFEDHYGDVLGKARFGLGLTPADAARRAGLATAEVAALEAGPEGPDEAQVRALAAVLELAPDRLAAFASRPGEPRLLAPSLPFVRIPVEEGFTMNAYVFADPEARRAAIVDPGGDLPAIKSAVERLGAEPAAILLTHAHADHVGALEEALALWNAPAYALEAERRRFGGLAGRVKFLPADAALTIGTTELRVLPVPGHTAGMAAFLLPAAGVAFVGDALFARSLGRAEAPGEPYAVLRAGVRARLLSLPPATILCPGHGPLTTAGDEARLNPCFP